METNVYIEIVSDASSLIYYHSEFGIWNVSLQKYLPTKLNNLSVTSEGYTQKE